MESIAHVAGKYRPWNKAPRTGKIWLRYVVLCRDDLFTAAGTIRAQYKKDIQRRMRNWRETGVLGGEDECVVVASEEDLGEEELALG